MRTELPHPSTTTKGLGSLWLPACVLAALGWSLGQVGQDSDSLHAHTWGRQDTDQDGLPDQQELLLGTDPTMADTDLDGYGDGEEFALQTSPTDLLDVPRGLTRSIGLTACADGKRVKLFAAVLDPDGSVADNNIRFGALINGQIVPYEFSSMYDPKSGTATGPMGGPLFLLEFNLPLRTLVQHPEVTFFVAMGVPGSSAYVSADKVDLFRHKRATIVRDILLDPGNSMDPNVGQTPGTTIHRPIAPGGGHRVPLDWEAGQVCYQQTQVVGVNGAVVDHEVTSADCVDGWDTYCASDCQGTVGSTYQTLDTGVLLGG